MDNRLAIGVPIKRTRERLKYSDLLYFLNLLWFRLIKFDHINITIQAVLVIRMSEEEKQIVQVFLNWVQDGGLAGWIEAFMQDEAKLREISQVYGQLREVFGV